MCILIALIFPLQELPLQTIIILIGVGIVNSLASIFYYKALVAEDATGATIFTQLEPLLYLILGWTILGEHIAPTEILAFILILLAPLIIIFTANKRSQKLEIRAITLLAICTTMQVVANIVFIKFSGLEDIAINNNEFNIFATAIFFTMIGNLITDTSLALIFKSWRTRFWNVVKKAKHRYVIPALINEIIYAPVDLVYRFALIIAPVAIVSVATGALSLIITFALGIILSILWPTFGREKLKKRIILAHLLATVLAVMGIIILQ
jgi:drug/metabolite transporter (DMT)-like permease